MLNKEVFFKGIEKLEVEYGDRGFIITKEKATQWYMYMKELPDRDYMFKIDNCLKTCKRVPYMADVLDFTTQDKVPRANVGAYREIKE